MRLLLGSISVSEQLRTYPWPNPTCFNKLISYNKQDMMYQFYLCCKCFKPVGFHFKKNCKHTTHPSVPIPTLQVPGFHIIPQHNYHIILTYYNTIFFHFVSTDRPRFRLLISDFLVHFISPRP